LKAESCGVLRVGPSPVKRQKTPSAPIVREGVEVAAMEAVTSAQNIQSLFGKDCLRVDRSRCRIYSV
jgi:hypothetical protein